MSDLAPLSAPSPRRLIVAGTRYRWQIALAAALGVATATAVIVGALLIGDSMRGSLRDLTIARLGKIQSLVSPNHFFSADGIVPGDAVAVILFPTGTVEAQADRGSGNVRRAGTVQIVGCDENFWDLDTTGNRPKQLPDDEGVVLNASAALELQVKVGDRVTVRMPIEQAVPADSPLGRRDMQSEGLPRMTVRDIIPDSGLGRFSLSPSQASPQIAFVKRTTIGDVLDRPGQANLLLFDREIETKNLNLDLEDLGVSLRRVRSEFGADEQQVIFDYYSVTSDQLLLPAGAVEQILQAFPVDQVTPLATYLANAIERLDEDGDVVASVPYSTITAIDSSPSLPVSYEQGRTDQSNPDSAMHENGVPMAINRWTAEQLDAKVGTKLRVAYYEPEVEKGKEIERFFGAIVTEIVPITEPTSPYRRRRDAEYTKTAPTVYNDPNLTPIVPGVTDQDSISDWDLPFQLERTIGKADDEYWNNHRLTPKAFLPLESGRKLFGSRFGDITGLRIAFDAVENEAKLREQLMAALRPQWSSQGWSVRPIRQQQLAASQGTTPFDGLFLALSFFLILSGILLIAMLFRLGLIQRSKEFGILLAVGWTPGRVLKLALGEGLLVAAIGVLLGVLGGIAYAVVVLAALRSWWVGAVTVPFLTFHWTSKSLILGGITGWMVAALTLWVTVRWLLGNRVQDLLSQKNLDRDEFNEGDSVSKLPKIAAGLVAFALVVGVWGAAIGGQAAAGGFIGGGMMLLVAGLIGIYHRLRRPRRNTCDTSVGGYSIGSMAARNATRHPMRSTMTIGLMATAAFLIISISAFRLQPTSQGTGGFALIAHSAQPIYRDLSNPAVQSELFGPEAEIVQKASIAPLRVRAGQDASCNNLYRATQPTVLGIPADFSSTTTTGDHRVAFAWAATDQSSGTNASPWDSLSVAASGSADDPIPVVIDQNTAMWSLQMTKGIGEVKSFEYEARKPIYFRVVGLLSNSVLQGRLMIGEENFVRAFPQISGYQFFFVACDRDQQASVASALETRLGDIGMDVSDAGEVLSGMLAVQNTYLRTFQSLGALGLLLGTIGLAVSQLRSVLERRSELAVMRAIGFTRKHLSVVVMSETASLLVAGIGCGSLCALLAVLPYWIISGSRPPMIEPLMIVLGIMIFGMIAGGIAVRRVAKMPLLESLRSE